MASGVYYKQEVTAEMLNGMAADLGHTSFNGFGNEKFGADEMNKITGDLVSAGVLITGNMCRVIKDDSGNIILQTGMADIRFYDLDFNLLHILPPYSDKIGYKAINAQQDFNGSGSFELLFWDNNLKDLVKKYRDNMLIVWRDFQGFLTSYKFNGKENHLYGTHINGLLHRSVIPVRSEKTDTVANLANKDI